MRNRIDIMTDIETLGVNESVAIIQLSAITFDIETGETISTFDEYVDIQNSSGLIIDGSTLKWWLKDEKRELFSEIIGKGNKSLKQVLYQFHKWVKEMECDQKQKYLWGNGILFDNRIIQETMRKHGLEYPIFYRNDRDMRTIVELAKLKLNVDDEQFKEMFKNESLVQHNAFDDCRYQINIVSNCFNILIK